MGKLRSNRVKRTPQTGITSDRYQYLGIEQAEPNLGDPRVGPSSVGANPIKAGTPYQLVAVSGNEGERYWTPAVGIGTTFGVISVYANGTLAGNDNRFERIHGLDFVGTGVTVETPPVEFGDGVGIATIRFTVIDQKNVDTIGQVVYNSPSGLLAGADNLVYYNDNVGLGSTLPSVRLDVVGSGKFTNSVTAPSFLGTATTSINVIGGIGSLSSLTVSGFSTLGSLSGIDAYYSGIVTASNFVGNLSGNATSSTNVSGGTANVTSLTVSGVSTLGFITGTNAYFTGIVTASGFVNLGVTIIDNLSLNTLTVSGVTTLGVTSTTSFNAQSLRVSGISTLGVLSGTNANFSGVVTASSFVGNLTGTATTATFCTTSGTATTATNVIGGIASVTSLSVSGVSTLGRVQISSGIITATSGVVTYYGDGSKLDNIASVLNIQSNSLDQSQFIPFATGTGNTSTLGVSQTELVFNPSSGNLGVKTSIPSQPLHVQGNIRVTGAYYDSNNQAGSSGQVLQSTGAGTTWTTTATTGTSTTAINVIGGIASVTSLSVSGVSTLGTVQISSGIITAISGIVTYYGDGSKLTGIRGDSIIGITSYSTNSGTATTAINVIGGIGSITSLSVSGVTTLGFISGTNANFTGVITATTFVGSLTGTATTATNLADAANITTGTINSARLSGNYSINITGTATTATNVIGGIGSLSALTVSGITTTGNLQVGTGGTIVTTTTSGLVGIGTTNPLTGVHIGNSGLIIGSGVTAGFAAGNGDIVSAGGGDKIFGIYNVSYGGTTTFSVYSGVGTASEAIKLKYKDVTIDGDLTVDNGTTYTTTIQTITPTADRTISLPDRTGTVALVAGSTGEVPYNSAGVNSTSTLVIDPVTTTFGYGVGGGTTTQATSKSTAVTLNAPCGNITLNNSALNPDTTVSFVLNNDKIASTDVIILNHVGVGSFGGYLLNARASSGIATIDVRNVGVSTLSEAIVIKFLVLKASIS